MNTEPSLKQPAPEPAGAGAAIIAPAAAVENTSGPEAPQIPGILPILAVRNTVVFPGSVTPLSVGRPESLKLLEESLPQSRIIGVVAQRPGEKDDPGPEDLYFVGTACQVLKMVRQAEGAALLLVSALQRFRIQRVVHVQPYIRAEVEILKTTPPPGSSPEWEAALKGLRDTSIQLLELTPGAPEELRDVVRGIPDAGMLADFVANFLNLDAAQKQTLLEELDVARRVHAVHQHVSGQLEIARIQQKLQADVSSQFTDMQRRAYLREQVRAIQRELGEEEQGVGEQVEELRKKLQEAAAPPAVLAQVERELKRLTYIPPASPEYSVIVTYAETIAELPWNRLSEDNLDLERAQKVLDRDHFDLAKVKRRLIEYLAVRKLNPTGHGAILCFLGPPGVGKTSLGQSIADALGRKFVRVSLGGMRDEAEIRGHRRTYIGSMPGRLIQELRRCGTRNPVMMLDEIDKLGADFRGDPSSALLEVLDPRQNFSFVDHYLDVPFDLSQIIFIATANYMGAVPPPLRDRMETIELPGYTDHEKLAIARNYLVRRQLEENGLKPAQCKWNAAALARTIEDYTREAGVRELERQIGSVCRAVAAQIARGERKAVSVTPEFVYEVLGPAKYIRETKLRKNLPGIVTGLAYTPFGGEVLHIEATRYPGKGGVTLTGQIGDVMKESVQAAFSLVRTRVKALGIDPAVFKETDIHVHVPSGAVPKDGPSAGVGMFTALASIFTDTPVRSDVAMTGEITLRGLVLPIGGLKEKTLAAVRAGIRQIIIPKLNAKDLPDVPEEIQRKVKFTLAETVDDVLAVALQRKKQTGPAQGPRPARKTSKAKKTRAKDAKNAKGR
jgi:ATP-dependent Lon protease